MKTKEFIEKVEALGYVVRKDGEWLIVRTSGGLGLLRVKNNSQRIVFITNGYENSERIGLLNVVVEYLNTPIADREEEKRYRLRLDVPLFEGITGHYLTRHWTGIYGMAIGDSPYDEKTTQVIFTASEIAEMDITGFVKEEVEG